MKTYNKLVNYVIVLCIIATFTQCTNLRSVPTDEEKAAKRAEKAANYVDRVVRIYPNLTNLVQTTDSAKGLTNNIVIDSLQLTDSIKNLLKLDSLLAASRAADRYENEIREMYVELLQQQIYKGQSTVISTDSLMRLHADLDLDTMIERLQKLAQQQNLDLEISGVANNVTNTRLQQIRQQLANERNTIAKLRSELAQNVADVSRSYQETLVAVTDRGDTIKTKLNLLLQIENGKLKYQIESYDSQLTSSRVQANDGKTSLFSTILNNGAAMISLLIAFMLVIAYLIYRLFQRNKV